MNGQRAASGSLTLSSTEVSSQSLLLLQSSTKSWQISWKLFYNKPFENHLSTLEDSSADIVLSVLQVDWVNLQSCVGCVVLFSGSSQYLWPVLQSWHRQRLVSLVKQRLSFDVRTSSGSLAAIWLVRSKIEVRLQYSHHLHSCVLVALSGSSTSSGTTNHWKTTSSPSTRVWNNVGHCDLSNKWKYSQI